MFAKLALRRFVANPTIYFRIKSIGVGIIGGDRDVITKQVSIFSLNILVCFGELILLHSTGSLRITKIVICI